MIIAVLLLVEYFLRGLHTGLSVDANSMTNAGMYVLRNNTEFLINFLLLSLKGFVNHRMTQESVVLETSLGDVQLELYWDHAPRVHSLVLISHSATYPLCRHVKTSPNSANAGITMVLFSTVSLL